MGLIIVGIAYCILIIDGFLFLGLKYFYLEKIVLKTGIDQFRITIILPALATMHTYIL